MHFFQCASSGLRPDIRGSNDSMQFFRCVLAEDSDIGAVNRVVCNFSEMCTSTVDSSHVNFFRDVC